MFAPTSLDLRQLFREPAMLTSRRKWRRAGFTVEGKGAASDIMVASHPSARGYLFKRYNADISAEEQLKNYRCRIKGAQKLQELITSERLTRIVVPGKYLYEVSPTSCNGDEPCYVLVVERLALALLDSSRSKHLYRHIDVETLREFCVVLREFSGLGSGARNVPFTNREQIAFVDTERWNEKKEDPLRRVSKYLSRESEELAKKFLQK